jgi:hypothetical protein
LGLPPSEWEGWVRDFFDNIAQLTEAQRRQLFANASSRSHVDTVPNAPGSYIVCAAAHERLDHLGIFPLAGGSVPLWRLTELRKNRKSPYSYYPDDVASSLGYQLAVRRGLLFFLRLTLSTLDFLSRST